MLSVLIPVYRYDVRDLVNELHRQCTALSIPFEIRLLDDGSGDKSCLTNKEVEQLSNVVWTELAKNIGRSKVRNSLAKSAKYEWLWFLDCDGDARVNPTLARTFWEEKDANTLLSGGRIYQANPPENHTLFLHWLWGSQRELLDPEIRMKDPVTTFLSNNFFLHKSLLECVPFDSYFHGYGYEDTFFAAELIHAGYKIKHIKNPVLHAGLENAKDFLKKIEESLDNLSRLKDRCEEKNIPFPVKSKLMKAYRVLNFPLVRPLFSRWFSRNLPYWKIQLLGKSPDLKTFDLYRLGFLLD
jgi:glycosyltransferase involved in cell wall biosynthesis